MARHPLGHPAWLDIMNPDAAPPVVGHPPVPEAMHIALADIPEEDPSEDESEEAEYHVGDYGSDNEGILEDMPLDDSEPEECITDEEGAPLLQSPERPYFPPSRGKGLMRQGSPKMSDMHRTLPDITPYLMPPMCGHKRKVTECPAHYEIGESSQAPPSVVSFAPQPVVVPTPPPVDIVSRAEVAVLINRIRLLEDEVRTTRQVTCISERRLTIQEHDEQINSAAIQSHYHRIAAVRTEAHALGARIQAVEYEARVTHTRLDAAEHRIAEDHVELYNLHEQFDDLVRYMAARFGR